MKLYSLLNKRKLIKFRRAIKKSEDKIWFKYCIKPFRYLPMSSTIYYSVFEAKKDLKEKGIKEVAFKETLHLAYGIIGKILIGAYLLSKTSLGDVNHKEEKIKDNQLEKKLNLRDNYL